MEGWNELLGTPKGFGLVAIAITARTLLIAAGPLLQHSVGYTQHPSVQLSITLPEHLPRGWAGTLEPDGYRPSGLLSAAYHGFAPQTPAQIKVRGCEGQCQLVISAPGLTIQDSDCISNTISVQSSDLPSWPTVSDVEDGHILFWSEYSTQFVDTPSWFGPAIMKPTQPLPVPPKDQETVAFYFTQVNTTSDAGTVYSKQCWVRSATCNYNLTIDSQGFVTNASRMASLEVNSDAIAGDPYRLNEPDWTTIATSFRELHAYLQSEVYFKGHMIWDTDAGPLGSSSVVEESSIGDYKTLDPIIQVMDILNDVYSRAALMYGVLGPALIDPSLLIDPRQM
jgi:hypothetical protein